jgi:hypothetical protein
MAKGDEHPWVAPYVKEYKEGRRRFGREQLDTEGYGEPMRAGIKVARELAKKYGQGHAMKEHGEGKPYAKE